MPKKTRQEKILSQLRRLREQTENTHLASLSPTEQPVREKPSYEITSLGKVKNAASASKIEVEDYSYVYKDLRKTVVFVTLAVIFEVILSLTASR
jgi:hypothetical protein